MTARTSESEITFASAFSLAAMDGPLPAGTYRLVTIEEEIPGISLLAYRRTATILYVPALSARRGSVQQAIPTSPEELDAIARHTKVETGGQGDALTL